MNLLFLDIDPVELLLRCMPHRRFANVGLPRQNTADAVTLNQLNCRTLNGDLFHKLTLLLVAYKMSFRRKGVPLICSDPTHQGAL